MHALGTLTHTHNTSSSFCAQCTLPVVSLYGLGFCLSGKARASFPTARGEEGFFAGERACPECQTHTHTHLPPSPLFFVTRRHVKALLSMRALVRPLAFTAPRALVWQAVQGGLCAMELSRGSGGGGRDGGGSLGL